jgi:FKBP-type peptidyl-prolyl cis-trans isomerase
MLYLLPDAAYGNKGFGVVPPRSTIIWRLSDIRLID